jgi:hypothetical protein
MREVDRGGVGEYFKTKRSQKDRFAAEIQRFEVGRLKKLILRK